MGLDGEFSIIRTQILATKPIPSLGNAYHLVAEDEQQRSIAGGKKPVSETMAFQASAKRGWTPNRVGQRENKGHCDHCGRDGHTRDGCFKIIGYPEWWNVKNKREKVKPKEAYAKTEPDLITNLTKEQYEQFQKHFAAEGKPAHSEPPRTANMAGKFRHIDKWIVDSGCTEHITHRSDALENRVKSRDEPPVIIPNGESIPVEGRGSHTLQNGTKVQDVLHVPQFTFNLLSVSKLTKDLSCAITFFPNFFVMQGLHSRKLIGAGRCEDGLYQMGMLGARRKAMMVTSDLWHKRLGHAGDEKLSQIKFLSNFSFKNSNNVCDSCMKSKFTRLPFPTSMTKTNACFELIHCDIWGKYRTPSFTKANYFLTIVDDYSRTVWVYLLRHKHEASTCIMHFYEMVKTQFEKKIKRIRCDNGGEFISNRMMNFYEERGIMLETTCPHTPQQNGIVERKHRHLLDTARALMFEASLPKRF